ncbi:hypothetical protein FOL47_008467 [Perkinsus chesapeaki]|uniref:Uncharacterized protein n=1 Tax=Perkinsus chesapeaki TaxID=330153 RepID=A0A7J6LEH8_PERCH|nr:hypothetical protein FOL47_008467 [Perkinsus chesapeaki]
MLPSLTKYTRVTTERDGLEISKRSSLNTQIIGEDRRRGEMTSVFETVRRRAGSVASYGVGSDKQICEECVVEPMVEVKDPPTPEIPLARKGSDASPTLHSRRDVQSGRVAVEPPEVHSLGLIEALIENPSTFMPGLAGQYGHRWNRRLAGTWAEECWIGRNRVT